MEVSVHRRVAAALPHGKPQLPIEKVFTELLLWCGSAMVGAWVSLTDYVSLASAGLNTGKWTLRHITLDVQLTLKPGQQNLQDIKDRIPYCRPLSEPLRHPSLQPVIQTTS
jgi:hypothetical protein